MKKVTLALSILAGFMSSAMATDMITGDLEAGATSGAFRLEASFMGTAVPCKIESVPAISSFTPIANGATDLSSESNSARFTVAALRNYTPKFNLTSFTGPDGIGTGIHGQFENLFEVRMGKFGQAVNDFTELTGTMDMAESAPSDAISGYATFDNAIIFQAKVNDYEDRYEAKNITMEATVTISCVEK